MYIHNLSLSLYIYIYITMYIYVYVYIRLRERASVARREDNSVRVLPHDLYIPVDRKMVISLFPVK